MTLFRLDERVALVTGAAGGIGRAIASTLASQGARLALADILGDEVQEVAESIGSHQARAYQADLGEVAQIERLVEQVVADFGGIDILVNNAGYVPAWPSSIQPKRTGSTWSTSTPRASTS